MNAKLPHTEASLMLTTEVMITDLPEGTEESTGGACSHNHGLEGMHLDGETVSCFRPSQPKRLLRG